MSHRDRSRDDGALVLLLAGGQGERLHPLTRRHAKPAVAFAGQYRVIDFTLSNCLNSGLKRIYVLTQHKSLSLDRHLRTAWSLLRPQFDEFVQAVPPQRQLVARWYSGTADAVFQNLHLLEEERPARVLLLSGDHVYRMDYRRLLQFHAKKDADVTIACTEVPIAEATRMGVLGIDDDERVQSFLEKPAAPPSLPHDPTRALVNMGIYVFRAETLVRAVIHDERLDSAHDFGHDVLPALVSSHRVYAYDVSKRGLPRERYWKDVGTLDTYYETNMALLAPKPSFDLFDPGWPVRTDSDHHLPAMVRDASGHAGSAANSILSPGAVVQGATVTRSVLSPHVHVRPGAVVEDTILLPGVVVGEDSVVRRAIVDEGVVLPPGTRIGVDPEADRRRFVVTPAGVAVVPERAVIA